MVGVRSGVRQVRLGEAEIGEVEIGLVQAEQPHGKVHVVRHLNSIDRSDVGVDSSPVYEHLGPRLEARHVPIRLQHLLHQL
jgi:hypothetical protein